MRGISIPESREIGPCEKSLSITQRLELRKEKLTAELSEIDDVLGKLNANPEIQNVLNAVSKMSF